jgi:PmbA protein
MEYEELVKEILGKFKKAHSDAEVFLQTGEQLNIDVREGKVENLKQAGSKGLGIRVLRNKKMSFVDSTDFSKGSVDALIDEALTLAGMASEDEFNVLVQSAKATHSPAIYDPEIEKIPIEKKIELLVEMEKKGLSYDSLITKSGGCAYSNSWNARVVGNTLGTFASYRESYFFMKASVVAEKGASQQPGEYETSSRFFSGLMDADRAAANAGYRAAVMVGGEPVKTQRAPVIFDRLTGERLLDGVASALNGEQVELQRSFLAGKLGQKIGSPLVTITDDGIMEKGNASAPVDGEGVPTQKRVVIKEGVLKGYMYNTRAAFRVKTSSTGNGVRWGYGDLPGIGAHNFYLAPGGLTAEEIVKGTDKGLYVLQTIGFGVDSESGGFSIGASGVWVEGGKIVAPVARVTVASSMLEMLGGIDAVAGDLVLDRGMSCPTFRIKEMMIGGA